MILNACSNSFVIPDCGHLERKLLVQKINRVKRALSVYFPYILKYTVIT
jgi:hypothetical protein